MSHRCKAPKLFNRLTSKVYIVNLANILVSMLDLHIVLISIEQQRVTKLFFYRKNHEVKSIPETLILIDLIVTDMKYH